MIIKRILKSMIKSITDSKYRYLLLCNLGFFNKMDDKRYLQKFFECKLGKKLNLNNPVTFNEKLQWLKLYDRKPNYTTMVDKYAVKKYVADIIGEEYIIPSLGVWNHFDEIDFDKLPTQFVLKCTHDSGGIVICNDKSNFDLKAAKRKIERSLKRNYYWPCREWPYKDVKPRIIAEEYLSIFEVGQELIEYKFFCFNGDPRLVLICKGNPHGSGRTNDFYDMDFKHLPVEVTYPNARERCLKPKEFNEMRDIARKLSLGIPHLRVDLYVANGKIYFGETTFFHDAGFCKFNPPEWDKYLGDMLELPAVKE